MNGRATWRRAFVASGRPGKPTTPLPRARPSGAQPIIVFILLSASWQCLNIAEWTNLTWSNDWTRSSAFPLTGLAPVARPDHPNSVH